MLIYIRREIQQKPKKYNYQETNKKNQKSKKRGSREGDNNNNNNNDNMGRLMGKVEGLKIVAASEVLLLSEYQNLV
eukprot:gene5704-4067_t